MLGGSHAQEAAASSTFCFAEEVTQAQRTSASPGPRVCLAKISPSCPPAMCSR